MVKNSLRGHLDEKFLLKPVKKFTDAVSVAVVYPGDYYTGMSNLGIQWLYSLLFKDRRVIVDRLFTGTSLKSTVFKKDIKCFDAVFLSITDRSQISEIKKIHKIVNKSRIRPLILGGGIGAILLYKEIINYVDLIFLGEIEPYFNKIIQLIYNNKENNEVVDDLKLLKPVICEEEDFSINKISIYDLDQADFPSHSCFITDNTEFKGIGLIQVARGCRYKCSFCAIGCVFKPYRVYKKESVEDTIRLLSKYTKKIGIMSADIFGVDYIKCILENWPDIRFSFSSLKVDNIDEEFLELYIKSGNKSATIAPETGSEKIGTIINKNIDNKIIKEKVLMMIKMGLRKIKMYFMYGIPGETIDDIRCSIDLINDIIDECLVFTKVQGSASRFIINFTKYIALPVSNLTAICPSEEYIRNAEKFIKTNLSNKRNIKLSITT